MRRWLNTFVGAFAFSFSFILLIFSYASFSGTVTLYEPNLFILFAEYILYIVGVPLSLIVLVWNYYENKSIIKLIIDIINVASIVGGLGLFYNIVCFEYFIIPLVSIHNLISRLQEIVLYSILTFVSGCTMVGVVLDSNY